MFGKPIMVCILVFMTMTIWSHSGAILYTGVHAYKHEHNTITKEGELHFGWQAGIMADFNENRWSFCPEFCYFNTSVKSCKTFNTVFSKESDYHITQLGTSLRYRFIDLKNFGLRIGGGIYTNYYLYLDDNDLGINFDTTADVYAGVNALVELEIYFLSLNFKIDRGLIRAFKMYPDSRFNGLSCSLGFFY